MQVVCEPLLEAPLAPKSHGSQVYSQPSAVSHTPPTCFFKAARDVYMFARRTCDARLGCTCYCSTDDYFAFLDSWAGRQLQRCALID